VSRRAQRLRKPEKSRRGSVESRPTCLAEMPPGAGAGVPQSFGFEKRARGSWCGRRDLNPHGPCGPTDFHTLLRLSPPPTAFAMGFGVWTIPSPCPDLAPGVRCCPSSLYTFLASFSRAWLGIAMLQGSPNLSSSASPVSRRALKFALKSGAYAISPRPHSLKRSTKQ
jgi:hypothetical protein